MSDQNQAYADGYNAGYQECYDKEVLPAQAAALAIEQEVLRRAAGVASTKGLNQDLDGLLFNAQFVYLHRKAIADEIADAILALGAEREGS